MLSGSGHRFNPRTFLIELVGDFNSLERRKKVAKLLANRIRRSQPFSESYIYNVAAGIQEASPRGELYLALRSVWMHKHEGHPIAGAYEPVEVRAIPARVETRSLILSRSVRCENIRCNIPFVPVVPWQKFCCKECREETR
jgi:hypothetical protein